MCPDTSAAPLTRDEANALKLTTVEKPLLREFLATAMLCFSAAGRP